MPADNTTRTPPVALLATPLLALLLPTPPAFARPPEELSGRIAFDEVADRLRKYHKEPDGEAAPLSSNGVYKWWKENEADLRCRASKLPR